MTKSVNEHQQRCEAIEEYREREKEERGRVVERKDREREGERERGREGESDRGKEL